VPELTIPLFPTATGRGWAHTIGPSGSDSQLINALFQVGANPIAEERIAYTQKRPGSTTADTYASGIVVIGYNGSTLRPYATSTALYNNTTAIGTIGGFPLINNYTVAEGVTEANEVYAFCDALQDGYYVWEDAISTNFPTFTGNRTSGSAVISGIASTTGIYPGQAISGDGIPASTRVLSVDSASQITMSANATSGAATATVITKEAVAKIIDADFPSDAVSMAYMDGYFFAGTASGKIYQSELNDPSSWNPINYINADHGGDNLGFLFKHGPYIVAAGTGNTIQYFYNNGNPSGSVLSAQKELTLTNLRLLCSKMEIEGGAFVLVGSSSVAIHLYRITGANQYIKISDDFWGNAIASNGMTSLQSMQIGKKQYLILTGGVSCNIVYDPSSNQFSIFDFILKSSSGVKFTKIGQTTTFIWASGNTWQDSSSAYTMTIQTEPKFLNGGKPFIIDWIDVICDTQASGSSTVLASGDDYANFDTLGTIDLTSQLKRIQPAGRYESSVAFKLTDAGNQAWRGQALKVHWTPCQ
jgi:hypothetical protein